MDLPKYTGIIHPEEWLRQVKIFCHFKQMTNEQEILKVCRLMIDSTITIPNEINTFDGLITTLKSHLSFNIFKNTCKTKLKFLKYVPEREGGNTATFLFDFRSLCNDAEINDLEKIKSLLINSYPNESYKMEFTKRANDINSIDEILKEFSDVVLDELNVVRYDSLITLKHVATGKYLSSCNINYQTGSKEQVVFASKKYQNFLWIVSDPNGRFKNDKIIYGNSICLIHKNTKKKLYVSNGYSSPTSGHAEVSCRSCQDYDHYSKWLFCKSNDNPTKDFNYVITEDVINLKSGSNYTLRSHELTSTIEGETFQEVVGHKERIGGNDKWCIELAEYKYHKLKS